MPAVNPQPKTLNTYEPNGTGTYSITFEYERESDVRVGLYNPTDKKFERTLADDPFNPWVFTNATTIQFTNGDPIERILIYRATDINEAVAEFYTGSAIRAQDLNANFTQLLFSDQELTDQVEQLTSTISSNTPINILPGVYPDDIPPSEDLTPGDSLIDASGNIWVWNGEIWINGGPTGGANGKGWTGGSYDETTGIVTFTSDDGLGFQTTDLRGEKGQQGVDGAQGQPGLAATITVGTTTTGTPGTPATVSNSGTTNAAIFDFVIPQGVPGQDGEDGQDGTSIIIKGTVTTPDDLPASGDVGDTWIDESTGDGYVWDGSSWVTIGSIQGPEGPQGPKGDGYVNGGYNAATGKVSFTGDPTSLSFETGDLRGAAGADGNDGADGKGWIGGVYNASNGIVTFQSDDGLSFNTGDIRGADGNNGLNGSDGEDGADGLDGKGWTGGFYSAGTGTVTFQSNDGLGFSTGDLRGPNGTGWTGGSYNAANGVVTFTSDDGLGFVTGDLRGADGSNGTNGIDGLGWTGGSYDSGTGVVTFTLMMVLFYHWRPERCSWYECQLQQCTDNGNTTTNKIQAAGFRIDQLTTITSTSP